jgi:integrase
VSRRGLTFKRCGKCGRRIEGKRCGKCGGESFSWSYVVDVAQPGEKRKQRSKAGFATRKEAQAALNDVLGSLQRGTYVGPSKTKLGDYLEDRWLPAIKSTVRPSTLSSYRLHVRAYIIPRLGSVPLQRLDGGVINEFYAALADDGRADGNGGLAPASVRRVHATLHRALKDAVRWGKLTRNPADAADPPRVRAHAGKEMTTWTAEELGRFLDSVADDPLYALWLTLASTGMRRGEALGLRRSDLDLEAGRASIRRTLITIDYELHVSTPKTKKGEREIALDPRTVEALRAHRKAQVKEQLAMGEHYQDGGLVFARPDGTPIHPDRASKLFNGLVARSRLKRIRLHDLRHTHATIALRAGIHPKVVSERLGHGSIVITLDAYSHAIPAMQQEAAETIAALVNGDR